MEEPSWPMLWFTLAEAKIYGLRNKNKTKKQKQKLVIIRGYLSLD